MTLILQIIRHSSFIHNRNEKKNFNLKVLVIHQTTTKIINRGDIQ